MYWDRLFKPSTLYMRFVISISTVQVMLCWDTKQQQKNKKVRNKLFKVNRLLFKRRL